VEAVMQVEPAPEAELASETLAVEDAVQAKPA
jgi:hypothetical protein